MRTAFINYRRADSEAWTLLLHKELVEAFGAEAIILDVRDLEPGVEYAERVLEQIRQSSALIVVIGPQWLTISDEFAPSPRLFQDDDLLRQEIAAGLAAGIDVIPVLVGGAIMPRADQLPSDISRLAAKNAKRVTPEYLTSDAKQIAQVLERAGIPRLPHRDAPKPGVLKRLGALPLLAKGSLVVALMFVGLIIAIPALNSGTTTATQPLAAATTTTTTTTTATTTTHGVQPTTSSTSPAPAPATSPAPASTTTVTIPAGCQGGVEPSIPVQAENVDLIEADLDGDGARDQLFVYNVPASQDFYRFRAVLADGYAYEMASEILFTRPPEFIASVDLDGDGDLEAFANYSGGASTVRVALLDFSNCVLTEFAELYVAGSIGGGGGFECLFGRDGNHLAVYSYRRDGELDYLIDVTTYKLEGGRLVQVARQEDIAVSVDDPLFDKSAGITCGELDIGF